MLCCSLLRCVHKRTRTYNNIYALPSEPYRESMRALRWITLTFVAMYSPVVSRISYVAVSIFDRVSFMATYTPLYSFLPSCISHSHASPIHVLGVLQATDESWILTQPRLTTGLLDEQLSLLWSEEQVGAVVQRSVPFLLYISGRKEGVE